MAMAIAKPVSALCLALAAAPAAGSQFRIVGRNATDEGKESKMAAVNKVISMLEDLDQQIRAEGEKEVHTYNNFACFCKDMTEEKTAAVTEGEDAALALTAKLGELTSRRDALDTAIKAAEGQIETLKGEIETADTTRATEHETYVADDAELTKAIASVEAAISVLKASKKPSMLQMQALSNTLREVVVMADALGLGGEHVKRATALLEQAPEVNMEDYKFHSADIISTLEGLFKTLRDEKVTDDQTEVAAQHTHNSLVQSKTDLITAQQKIVDDSTAEHTQKVEDITTQSKQFSMVQAKLLDDKQYLNELYTSCHEKANTWDQRSQTRENEISAITAALTILKGAVSNSISTKTARLLQQGPASLTLARAVVRSPAAMMSLEAAAEAEESGAAPLAFFQQRRLRAVVPRHGDARSLVVALLKARGQELKSTMLSSLAGRVAEDHFVKIRGLITDLIAKLEQEAEDEATQKGYCDKALSEARDGRDQAAEKIAEINSKMGGLEALRDGTNETLTVLAQEISDIGVAMSDADAIRNSENVENAATVTEAQEGMSAVDEAISILSTFYGAAATAEVSLVEKSRVHGHRGPAEDAPATFGEGEAYQGSQGAAEGITAMLEVIKSDFQRTAEETERAEEEAVQAHAGFTQESQASLDEKGAMETERTTEFDETTRKLGEQDQALDSEVTILKAKIEELIQLHAECIDTGMSYQERVAKREEEINSLNKALCILDNNKLYSQEGGAGMC